MFNYCFLSGEVLTEPELKCLDNEAAVVFELGAMAGQWKVGGTKIVCFQRLAVAAAKHIHQGDYVSVMGYIWYLGKIEGQPGKEDPEIIALHMEFVRSDSHLLGPIFPNEEEEN